MMIDGGDSREPAMAADLFVFCNRIAYPHWIGRSAQRKDSFGLAEQLQLTNFTREHVGQFNLEMRYEKWEIQALFFTP